MYEPQPSQTPGAESEDVSSEAENLMVRAKLASFCNIFPHSSSNLFPQFWNCCGTPKRNDWSDLKMSPQKVSAVFEGYKWINSQSEATTAMVSDVHGVSLNVDKLYRSCLCHGCCPFQPSSFFARCVFFSQDNLSPSSDADVLSDSTPGQDSSTANSPVVKRSLSLKERRKESVISAEDRQRRRSDELQVSFIPVHGIRSPIHLSQ